ADDERADTSAVTFSLISLSMTAGALVGGRLPGLLAPLGAALAPETVLSYRATLVAGVALAAVGLVPLLAIGRGRPASPAQTGPLIGNAHRTRRVRNDMAAFVAVGALFSVSAAAIVPFYNVYLQDLGADPGVIGTVFSVAGVCGAVLGLLSPALARRYGVLRVAAGMRFAGVPLIALLLFAPSLPLAFAAQIVRSATLSMAWPVDSNFIAEILPNRQRATVFSLRSAAWNLTWAGASFIVGRLIVASGGYGVAFVTSCAFAALAVAVFSLYFLRHPHVVAQREAADGRRQTTVKVRVGG
ncbi:MAG TPA: MFS transporter, partial [Thermomicrobiales bacterium]|nr:MFS transporter [Thermomicrobiales bacterium]